MSGFKTALQKDWNLLSAKNFKFLFLRNIYTATMCTQISTEARWTKLTSFWRIHIITFMWNNSHRQFAKRVSLCMSFLLYMCIMPTNRLFKDYLPIAYKLMEFIRAMTNIYYYLFQTRLVLHYDGNGILKRFPTIFKL